VHIEDLMTVNMRIFILFFVTLVCLNLHADYRVWEDQDGNRYEAEFVRELFDKVTLREKSGKEHRLALEELSEIDQKYIRVMVPPNMSVEARVDTTIKPKPVETMDLDRDQTWIHVGKVEITKKSRRAFTSRLYASMYLIAEELDGDNYILLSKTESDFLFDLDFQNTHSFETDPVETRQFAEYNGIQRRGEEDVRYLLVIRDAQGNIVLTDTDDGDWLMQPAVIEALDELYIRGKGSVYSRHFDQTGQKTMVPRPKYYTSRHH
jgi:hypothetical protein